MSQVSYGTITITDTTDIEDVFLIYKGSSSNTVAPSIVWSDNTHNDWETDITQVTGDYIWAITVFKRTGITITNSNYTDYYSDPACLTGEPGTSISITSIKYSTLTTQTQPADSTFTLTNPPTIPEGEWLWSRTLFSNGQSMYSKAKQGKSPIVSKTGNTVTITGADGNTVTVTDGASGQSYYTYIRYATDSSGSNMDSSPTGKTYIGVYTGTSSSAPTTPSSYAPWMKYIGTDGSPGATGPQGVSVTSVRELYYLTAGTAPNKPTSSTTIYDDDRVGAWTSVVPSYIVDGNYYISLETTLSNSTKVWSDVILDQALTDANYNAYLAQSLSQNANENANGALSQANSNINSVIRLWQAKSIHSVPNAPSSEVTTGSTSTYNTWSTVKPTATDTYRYFYYCDQSKTGGGVCSWSEVIEDTSYLSTYEINALNVRTKNFFKGLDNTYDGWFASGRLTSEGLNESNAETYLYNARFAATHISLGYNKTPIIDLDGSSGAIDIYRFPTINSDTGLVTAAGKLGMKLNATSLIFYKPDESSAATLNSNGLVLSEGGIEAGTKNSTDYIYIYSKDDSNHSIAINNSGNKTDWRIVAGNKFGVDKAGNLYASNAIISGVITVNSGSNVYTKTEADSEFDASGAAATAQANAISAAATDATNKANAAQSAAEATAAADATSKANAVNNALESYKTTTNSTLSSLQSQVDGQIEAWYYSVDPTTNNPPASSWDTDTLKARHEGDLYYNVTNGHSWRWMKSGNIYSWQQIPDGDAAAALAAAQNAQTTANSKRRIFTAQPTTPYDVGDLWVNGNEVKYCSTSKTDQESYTTTDWTLTATDDTLAQAAKDIADAAAPKSSAIAEEQRIYYRSSAVSNNVPIKPNGNGLPTTWVTETGDKYNSNATTASGWSKKITPIANGTGSSVTKYLYLWTCIQRKKVNGDVTYGEILLDDSITVIDGGKIITGSVSANSINASSGTFDTALIPQLTISKINTLQTVLDGKAASGAENTALSYLSYDSTNGLKIAGSNPSTATTNYIQITGDNINIVKSSTYKATIDAINGLLIYAGDASNAVAQFGSTMRIGKTNNSAFYINSDSLQAYYMNGSTRTKYFEVSPTSLTYGAYTAASTTYADGKASAAEANASYSVEIEVSSIDFVNNNATLVAHPYFKGVKLTNSTTPALSTITGYSWSRADGTAIPSGVTINTKTLQLPNNSDLSATYVCTISKA